MDPVSLGEATGTFMFSGLDAFSLGKTDERFSGLMGNRNASLFAKALGVLLAFTFGR